MGLARLERSTHAVHAEEADSLSVWRDPAHGEERYDLHLRDPAGGTVVTVYGLTPGQLAALSLEVARALGQAPDLTRFHLRQAHDLIGRLLGEAGGAGAPAAPGDDWQLPVDEGGPV